MPKSETGRVEAFSDGVFAVAITLLILTLKVPAEKEISSKVSLWHLLVLQWPSFLAFVTSFITILFIWLNHHMVMRLIHVNNGNFMLINGLLLLFVTLLPFSTAVLAEHLGHSGSKDGIIFYNGSLFSVASMFQIFWKYAIKNERLLGPECDKLEIKRIDKQFKIGFILYSIAFVSSFFVPIISLGISVFLAAYFTAVGIFSKHS
jgi:uncharacterized membrane protein